MKEEEVVGRRESAPEPDILLILLATLAVGCVGWEGEEGGEGEGKY